VIKLINTLLFIFLSGLLRAQFNLNSYLGSAKTDFDINEIYKKLEYLGENEISSPVINRLELRLQTNDLNITPDDFKMRISPTNPRERIMNKQYNKIQISSLNNDLQFALNTALKTRYQLFINYLYYKEKLNCINDEMLLLNDELTVIKGKSEFETLDVEDFIDTEAKLTNLQVNKTEIGSRLEKIEITIKSLYDFNGNKHYNINQLISIENINSLIKEISTGFDSSNIYLTHVKSKYDLKESKYNVDLSESSRNLGFLQARYRIYRGNDPTPPPVTDRLGIEIGIRIPITNADKADNQRSYLNLMDDHYEIAKRENWLTNEQQFSLINLIASISKYQTIDAKLEQLFPDNSLDFYKKHISKDADKLLKIKNSQIKMNDSKLEYLEEIYSNYIDFLDIYGKLSEIPLKNYLLPGLDQI
jgi:hypothetical protein